MSQALFMCPNAVGGHWSVGASVREPVLLVGWPTDGKTDAGMPAYAGTILAAAFASRYDVSFLTTSAEAIARAIQVLELPPVGLLSRTLGRAKRRVITTRDPDLVQMAFDDEQFPWWLQAQFLLLSAVGASIQGAAPLVHSLLQNPPRTPLPALSQFNVEALVIPGVDGDLAGIRTSAESVRKHCVDAISEAAKKLHVSVHTMNEAEFASALAR